MTKKIQESKQKIKSFRKFILPITLFFTLVILVILTFEVIFMNKFLPRVYIGDSHLGFLDQTEAQSLLQAKFDERVKIPVLGIDLSTASATLNSNETLTQAFAVGHQGSWYQKLLAQIQTLIFKSVFTPKVDLEANKQIDKIAQAVLQNPKDATLSISDLDSTTSAKIQITPGKDGQELDKEKLIIIIKDYLIFGHPPAGELPLKIKQPKITNQKAEIAKNYLEQISQNPIKLNFQNQNWDLDAKTLITLLDYSDERLINKKMITSYLQNLAKDIDNQVVEAKFEFNSSLQRVTAFKPSTEGRKLDIDKAADLIILALNGERSKTITLPVDIQKPKIQTEQVNNLGIKELLGQGISRFAGSIPNRIYNLNLAASRINGVLIPPGDIFSFNDKVGDISASSGYKQAYVIKEGRTVLDDGGGVCQDSTTLFRAVLNAGLPVVARTAHAYRVGYYEQGFPAGLDATVFSPSVDFKFKNDTSAHILIQAYTSGNTLYVDLYGTSDGRISRLTTPVVANQTPPPPEIRQDDPTLPRGEIKQVDWAAWGADVSFKRTVTRNGENIISETWRSKFKPWQAIYLVGTKE